MSPVPSVDELLAAMQGNYDPQHPRAEILRAAWLLAKNRHWFCPGSVVAVHPVSTHGPGIHVENGTEALAALDVDLANIVDDALLGRIAESVDGNREYALALSELALGWAAVADARIQFGQCCDAVAEERFAEAAADYVRIAGGPPIVAANSPTMN